MTTSPEWSANLVNQLCQMWDRGDSASQCAKALGVTKNAVIGKINRLRKAGYPIRREKMDRPQTIAASLMARAVARVRSPRAEKKAPSPNLSPRMAKVVEPKVKEPIKPPVIFDASFAKPWTERRFGECAYPIGGEGADTVSCCAPTKGKAYCQGHHRLMFRAPPKTGDDYAKRTARLAA